MDAEGARLLRTRIAVGAAPGARVEVVSVADAAAGVRPGDTGTLLSIGTAEARILFDSGETVAVDPFSVQLQPIAQAS